MDLQNAAKTFTFDERISLKRVNVFAGSTAWVPDWRDARALHSC